MRQFEREKLTIVDYVNIGSSHVWFNYLCIKALEERFKLNFIANTTHIKALKGTKCVMNEVYSISRFWPIQMLYFFGSVKRRLYSKEILILGLDNYAVPFYYIFRNTFGKKENISIIIHNNISGLRKSGLRRIIFKVFVKKCSVRVFTLASSANKEFTRIIGMENILLPHPNYKNIWYDMSVSEFNMPNKGLNIVVIGRQARHFLQKTIYNVNLSQFTNINFLVFSISNPTTDPLPPNVILYNERISFEKMKFLMSSVDYFLFPNDQEQYRASGLLMDCISNYCPVIAPKIGHFEEFDIDQIGFFYRSYSNLAEVLSNIHENSIKRDKFRTSKFKKALEMTNSKLFQKILTNNLEGTKTIHYS